MPNVATRKKSAGPSIYTPVEDNIVIAERRLKIVELIVEGTRKPRVIAEIVGVSIDTVSNDLKVLEKEMTEQAMDLVSQVRDRERMVEWMHLEELRETLMKDVRDNDSREIPLSMEDKHRAVGRLLNVSERKAKLLGLDMPSKTALTDPSGENEYKGIPKDVKNKFLGTTTATDEDGTETEAEVYE
jgi:transposase